jgi:hypothetical protein
MGNGMIPGASLHSPVFPSEPRSDHSGTLRCHPLNSPTVRSANPAEYVSCGISVP